MAKRKGDIEHLDFDEYIREGEPDQRDRAYAWRTAIGLQAVDGLQVSDYLRTTARRNIEGEISIDVTGRKPGRGAYVCRSAECLKTALKQKQLERAFACALDEGVRESLLQEMEKAEGRA